MAKKHNWTTNFTVVDRETNRMAVSFIGGCNHLTPEREAELDGLIGIGTIETDQKPKEIMEEEWGGEWNEEEPTAADLRAIESGK